MRFFAPAPTRSVCGPRWTMAMLLLFFSSLFVVRKIRRQLSQCEPKRIRVRSDYGLVHDSPQALSTPAGTPTGPEPDWVVITEPLAINRITELRTKNPKTGLAGAVVRGRPRSILRLRSDYRTQKCIPAPGRGSIRTARGRCKTPNKTASNGCFGLMLLSVSAY